MVSFYFAVIFVLVLHVNLSRQEDSCKINATYKYMSSKTDYPVVANISNMVDYKIEGCKPIGMWLLSRHGARYPDADEIIELNTNMEKIKEFVLEQNNDWICDSDKESIREWQSIMKPEQGNTLTTFGRMRMRELGKRYAQRLADLVQNTVVADVYVQATDINRTIDSANEYLDGFFENWIFKPEIKTANKSEDYLLKYPDICERYIKNVDKNKDACPELEEFENRSLPYKIILDKFKSKFLNGKIDMDPKKMFDYVLKTCQYEYLINNTNSIWCKYFDNFTLQVTEYQQDIESYCYYSYKHEISRLMTCDLVSDLLEKLRAIQKSDTQFQPFTKKLTFYFSHSSTLLTFYSMMGLYKNQNDFNTERIEDENENRLWRESKIDPMNANLAFILYKCNSSSSNFKIQVFNNEHLVKVDGCSSTDCDFDEFVEYYQNFKRACGTTRDVCMKDMH